MKVKNKKSLIFKIYVTICVLLITLFFTISFRSIKNAPKIETVSDTRISENQENEYIYVFFPNKDTKEASNTESNAHWILREHNGMIGIFSSDGSLIYTLDTYINTLPKQDRALLLEGIYANTRDELLSLIEDYTG